MSHTPERKEKDCLNCGITVQGRFCHVCGQENTVPKESFWNLVLHFFYDITHFDSKFFDSLKYLFFRPGFLSKEYIKGRRASYLNPIRMYVFTSAVFFLIFFSIRGDGQVFSVTGDGVVTRAERDSLIPEYQKYIREDPYDNKSRMMLATLMDTSIEVKWTDIVKTGKGFRMMTTWGEQYESTKEYDSAQQSKPSSERDGWLKSTWNKRVIRVNEKYSKDPENGTKKFSDSLLHMLPYLLFVSLPFFALILKLLYIRRKEFYYGDHGIFSVHHYIFSFILLLFVFLWNKLHEVSGWGIWNFLLITTVIAWPLHLFFAMKRFYGQGIIKTFFKFLLLNIAGLIVLALLFAFFVLFSVFQL